MDSVLSYINGHRNVQEGIWLEGLSSHTFAFLSDFYTEPPFAHLATFSFTWGLIYCPEPDLHW
jgi:hypothetical protein